jgi:hypothetical protein
MTRTSLKSDYPAGTPGGKTIARGRWNRALRYIKTKLMWSRLYRVASYLKAALWIVPLIALVLVTAIVPVLRILDSWLTAD